MGERWGGKFSAKKEGRKTIKLSGSEERVCVCVYVCVCAYVCG
jgi:hypothetical protein